VRPNPLARLAVLVAALTISAASLAQSLTMAGGFAGGTFNDFVDGIAATLAVQVPGVQVTPAQSLGSVENLLRMREGEFDMAVVFAGDGYLAFNGLDAFDDEEQTNRHVRAVGFLYSAVSQVVTLADSGIETFDDLVGKRIAVGEVGSGTHMAIHRLLVAAGVRDEVFLQFISGIAASEALLEGRVDAYHVLLGTPNATVRHTAAARPIRLLDTMAPAIRAGLFDRYPFYTPVVVPAGTYAGIDIDIPVFKDGALWVVAEDLDEELVYRMTQAVYGTAGLAAMNAATPVAREMGVATAIRNVAFPLHPGAARYWQEMGVQLPAAARP
jgi:uncharacterized protein